MKNFGLKSEGFCFGFRILFVFFFWFSVSQLLVQGFTIAKVVGSGPTVDDINPA